MLKGRRILLGVTGSIAAYKAAILVRLLAKAGAEVQVIMTPLAKEFITPLTLATLSKRPILVDFFNPEDGRWNSHVSLGEWADLYLIAPATANTLAKMAGGVADNLLLTSYLSARCPVLISPAMDLDMYSHPATQANIEKLRSLGVGVIEPGDGELASGLVGKGRMAEPEQIVAAVEECFAKEDQKKKSPLKGKHVMVTAGATIEAIDPVRFISNHSTGKMGYAIAEELANRGATVTLVSGPTNLSLRGDVKRVDVVSADDMYTAATEAFTHVDAAVMCAAVADYTPIVVSDTKIKKSGDQMSIALRPTRDIAAELGRQKGDKVLIGFALETDREQENALGKMQRKGFDFIVLNSLNDKGAGFGHDTNKITILESNGKSTPYPLISKREAASEIVDKLEEYLLSKN